MTIYLFHGENQPALRDALLELKKSYRETTFWEKDPFAGKAEAGELALYLASPTFFGVGDSSEGRRGELVVIEDLKLDYLDELISLARKGSKDILIAFADKIPIKKLPKGGGLRIRYFREEIPQNIFPFLDALGAKDRRKAFAEAHRLLREGEDVHFLLTMIFWQMRNLAQVKGGAVRGLHPYVLGKLRRLEKNFGEEDLSRIFSLLLKEDLAAKKGRTTGATFDFLIERLTS